MKLEFQTLAEKVYPPDIARQLIIAANYQVTVVQDDALLDNNLELLRIKADVLLKIDYKFLHTTITV